MMPKKKDNNNLLNPASAVENYFDTLLQDEVVASKPLPQLKQQDNLLYMPGLEAELAMIDLAEEEEEAASPDPVDVASERSLQQSMPRDQSASQQPSRHDLNRQDAFEFPLQCLMFSVQGNQLSIPLIEMGSVLCRDQKMTRLPGSPSWLLGLMKHRQQNVRVVDTAGLLSIPVHRVDPDTQHILVFGSENWAITCDQLGEVVKLDKDDVQWRRSSADSPSMGTIKQSLAMLLDPTRVLEYLNRYQHPHS